MKEKKYRKILNDFEEREKNFFCRKNDKIFSLKYKNPKANFFDNENHKLT